MNDLGTDIVITGWSAITCAGTGLEPVIAALRAGESFLHPVPPEAGVGAGLLWGRADGFRAGDFIPPLKARKLDRCSQLTVATAGLALKDAGIVAREIGPERVGIALGCGFGGVGNSAEFLTGYFESGTEGLQPLLFPNTVSNAPASNASIEWGLKGPNVTLVQRLCSAEAAFMLACRFIAEGRADVMLTGGADDLLPLISQGFDALGQLARHGRNFADGAGILVLESAAHAAARGARPRGRVGALRTVGMLHPAARDEGVTRLVPPGSTYDLVSLSGSAPDEPLLLARVDASPRIATETVIGRSLAMGGTAMAALLALLPPGGHGLHLAASPEGPYFAIEFTGHHD
ncbi:MAG TPA: beta-ketoacyl synthase N-terminal-like domain-containing protein [Geobacteraceae bacterium]